MGAIASQITSLTIVYRLFRRRSKKTSQLRVTGLCAGNSPGTDEFPAQMASNAENVSIWWRHHEKINLRIADFRSDAASIEPSLFNDYGSDRQRWADMAVADGLVPIWHQDICND